MTIIENLQRADLNPMEQARAFDRLGREFQMTQEQMAKRTGKDRASVSNFLRLLRLPTEIQGKVEAGELSFGHARTLLALESPDSILKAAQKVLALSMSVRQTESFVQNMLNPEKAEKKEKSKDPLDPNVREARDQMQRALGLKVAIEDRGGKGKVIIEYTNLEAFDSLMERITATPHHERGMTRVPSRNCPPGRLFSISPSRSSSRSFCGRHGTASRTPRPHPFTMVWLALPMALSRHGVHLEYATVTVTFARSLAAALGALLSIAARIRGSASLWAVGAVLFGCSVAILMPLWTAVGFLGALLLIVALRARVVALSPHYRACRISQRAMASGLRHRIRSARLALQSAASDQDASDRIRRVAYRSRHDAIARKRHRHGECGSQIATGRKVTSVRS